MAKPKQDDAPTPSTESTASIPSIADLQAQLDAANAAIAGFKAENAQRAVDETAIGEKMRHGLNRQQAIASIQRQKEFDAANPTKTVAFHKPDANAQSPFTKAKAAAEAAKAQPKQ